MDKSDFLNKLRRDAHVVFDEISSLDASHAIIANALASDLGEILSSDNEVHYGVQLEGLDFEFSGTLHWILVADQGLVLSSAKVEGEGDQRALRCDHELCHWRDLRRICVGRRYRDRMSQPTVAASSITFEFSGNRQVTIEGRKAAEYEAIGKLVEAVSKGQSVGKHNVGG